jgi:acyl carrier protein
VSTLETIRALAAQQLGLDPTAIEPDVPVADYGVDSLGLIEFMFVLEDVFHVQIGKQAGPIPKTLRELAGLLDALLQSANHRQIQAELR